MVTGGSGFVGSHIVDALEKHFPPSSISLIVRNPTKVKIRSEAGITVFQGDITNLESLHRVMTDFRPNVVIHAAALADDWAPLSKLMETNAQGTQNIIDAMVQSCTADLLIHISSSGVYPRKTSVHLAEDTPYGPYGDYHKSKVAAEEIVKATMEKRLVNTTIIRPPNVMGIRDFTHMARICQAIKKRKFPIINEGKAIQTWVAAEDLAQAVILAINLQKKASGQIYNVKSFEISVKELYNQIASRLNITKPPKKYSYRLAYIGGFISEIIGKLKQKPSTLNRYRVIKFGKDRLFDDSKIRSELNYQPIASAKDTIADTVTWLQKEGIV
ncbi:MAG: NAD(P)-dependent oxidoreductase [Candidatus Heimdallarchaeota archaeon]|nr:MAG: NAD(P)-dependent oxidoreductase [Candidatus Heimdallarchaeota archaeon]